MPIYITYVYMYNIHAYVQYIIYIHMCTLYMLMAIYVYCIYLQTSGRLRGRGKGGEEGRLLGARGVGRHHLVRHKTGELRVPADLDDGVLSERGEKHVMWAALLSV